MRLRWRSLRVSISSSCQVAAVRVFIICGKPFILCPWHPVQAGRRRCCNRSAHRAGSLEEENATSRGRIRRRNTDFVVFRSKSWHFRRCSDPAKPIQTSSRPYSERGVCVRLLWTLLLCDIGLVVLDISTILQNPVGVRNAAQPT